MLGWRKHVQDPNSQRIALWNLEINLQRIVKKVIEVDFYRDV
jgi:hypothetical protein